MTYGDSYRSPVDENTTAASHIYTIPQRVGYLVRAPAPSPAATPPPKPRSQRELVIASLLRKPEL